MFQQISNEVPEISIPGRGLADFGLPSGQSFHDHIEDSLIQMLRGRQMINSTLLGLDQVSPSTVFNSPEEQGQDELDVGSTGNLKAALSYAELGYSVFPLIPNKKVPLADSHGHLDATTDFQQIRNWWNAKPEYNIGIATTGLLIVDIDGEENPWPLDNDHKADLGDAPSTRSARGGRHYYFRQPPGKSWRNSRSKIADNVDIRADGGYIVAPPSVYKGKPYQWADGQEFDWKPSELHEPPEWLQEQLGAITQAGSSSSDRDSLGEANTIPEGQRNGTLASLGGSMRRAGMSVNEIEAALLVANKERCSPPLPVHEVHQIAESISKYEPDQKAVAQAEGHGNEFDENWPNFLTSAELMASDERVEYLINGLLVAGQPCILAGQKKCLKTNILIEMAISLATKAEFLGKFIVPDAVTVGIMSGESGIATIKETAERIARSKSLKLENCNNISWMFDLPKFGNPRHEEKLEQFIKEKEIKVLMIDPAYLCLPIGGDAGNLFMVGNVLQGIGAIGQRTGCTIILVHHTTKRSGSEKNMPELADIAWSGFQEWARQWILLGRRRQYDPENGGHHELWVNAGGSAGHSQAWALNINEGTPEDRGGRRWNVEVLKASEAKQNAVSARQLQKEKDRERVKVSKSESNKRLILDCLHDAPTGFTVSKIKQTVGLGHGTVKDCLDELLESSEVEECEVLNLNNNRKYDGYRLVSTTVLNSPTSLGTDQ